MQPQKNLGREQFIELLERRMLFDVQVNSPAFDVPGPVGPAANIYSEQMETTSATFSPPGSNDHVVVAYNDGAMQQY
ncbi:MAG TPA: hypothetical protein VFW23_03365, partial [Tepidisphaeraceae bacterium]|nr:hypothetical protein [Tepidisphaeraceae bacterium]